MNKFLVYSPICMKFAPNSSFLEILSFWLGVTVSDPFPLTNSKINLRNQYFFHGVRNARQMPDTGK